MAGIKVHGPIYSAAVQRVVACLHEKELEFELVPLDMKVGEHKTEAFLSLNPFGQVPAFEHGDQKLFESRAITQYIAHEFADKGTQFAFPGQPIAPIVVWKEVEAHQFELPASKLSWEFKYKPILGMAIDAAIVEENEAKLAKVLDVYEARLLKSKYLACSNFTLADLHHLPHVDLLMGTQAKKLFDSHPHVSAWVADITSRPAWCKVLDMVSKVKI